MCSRADRVVHTLYELSSRNNSGRGQNISASRSEDLPVARRVSAGISLRRSRLRKRLCDREQPAVTHELLADNAALSTRSLRYTEAARFGASLPSTSASLARSIAGGTRCSTGSSEARLRDNFARSALECADLSALCGRRQLAAVDGVGCGAVFVGAIGKEARRADKSAPSTKRQRTAALQSASRETARRADAGTPCGTGRPEPAHRAKDRSRRHHHPRPHAPAPPHRARLRVEAAARVSQLNRTVK